MTSYLIKGRKRANGKRGPYRGRYCLEPGGQVHEVPLHTTDKQVAQKNLDRIVAEAEREAAGIVAPRAQREAAAKFYGGHVEEFLADLEARGRGRHYVVNMGGFLTRLGEACGWCHLSDITTESFEKWRANQGGLSAKSLNEYLGAIRNLVNWLRARGRIAGNPLEFVGKVATSGRETRQRRALTDDEAHRLLYIAGPRMPVYLVALTTGLRQKEIKALRWSDVSLDAAEPHVVARASTTKNKKTAILPLRPEVVRVLRELKERATDQDAAVFRSVPRARELRVDLNEAGIRYQDAQGRYADFHALRHTFITNLGRTGVSERIRMEAARHSDPRLTAKVYTDTTQLPIAAAVMGLPDLLSSQSCSHIRSQKPDADRHSVSLAGAAGQNDKKSEPVGGKEKGHGMSQNDAPCPCIKNGSGGWIRTSDQVVNSHLLYR